MLKFDIYRIFLTIFGAVQILSNSIYLIRKNGVGLARKQHSELPKTATDRQVFIKMICMLSFGILLFATGVIVSFVRSSYPIGVTIALGAYTLYALIEALYYRSGKTTGAFILPLVLLAAFFIF
ncbi:MAG TPA: hypothetical protein DEB31_08955 [Clostridiales bacterium]|nr:hypothetical protein [Clostridiales bacterium]